MTTSQVFILNTRGDFCLVSRKCHIHYNSHNERGRKKAKKGCKKRCVSCSSLFM